MRTWSPAQTIPAAGMRKGPRLTTTLNLTQQGRDRRAAEQPGPQPAPLTPPIVLGDLRQLWAKVRLGGLPQWTTQCVGGRVGCWRECLRRGGPHEGSWRFFFAQGDCHPTMSLLLTTEMTQCITPRDSNLYPVFPTLIPGSGQFLPICRSYPSLSALADGYGHHQLLNTSPSPGILFHLYNNPMR